MADLPDQANNAVSRCVLFTCFATLLLVPAVSNALVALVQNGEPQGVIVIPYDAPDSVRFAAVELQEHIEKISGARLPINTDGDRSNKIVAALGDTRIARAAGLKTSELPPDGFNIAEYDDVLVIAGRDYHGPVLGDRKDRTKHTYNREFKINAHGETGTQFGVYRFLHDLGVRWYMPGDVGLVVPESKDVIYDGQPVKDNPYFSYRKLHGFTFDDDPEAAKWYKRIGYGSVRYVNINHSLTNWADRFWKTHPEYFARVNGRPHTETVRDKKRVAFNYTNEGTYQQVLNDMEDFFTKHPNEEIFPVVPNDSHVIHDESEKTLQYILKPPYSSGWLSDLVWGFVDKVAREAYKKHPDKYIASLSYAYQFDAPELIDKFSPNVVVMHCRQRLQTWDDDYRKHIDKELKNYQKLKPAKNYVWEYYNLRSRDEKLQYLPYVAPHLIVTDIRKLKGFSEGEFIQANQSKKSLKLINPAYYHVNLYVTAKALWDPELNVENLLNEYYEKYYGPANTSMGKFWNRLEDIWVSQPGVSSLVEVMSPRQRNIDRKNSWKYYWREVYNIRVVNELFDYLEEAKKSVKDSPEIFQRLLILEAQFENMKEMSYRINK